MEKGILYLIPTPIGNMDDLTYRSVKILKEVDVLFCEDTRETGQLLSYLEIKVKMIPNHNFNETKNLNKVIELLNDGKKVGIVSDRGTPVISDPGWEMVREVVDKGFEVIPLPGANALIPALIASGIESTPFMFYGFLDSKEEKRKKELKNLREIESTLIFYESPHRIYNTVENILEVMGNRKICISREISKKFEEHIRGQISEVLPKIDKLKGEIVIILERNKEKREFSTEDIIRHVNYYTSDMSNKEAIKKVSEELRMNKNDVYRKYHNL